MPLLLITALGGVFLGSQIDNAVSSFFGKKDDGKDFNVTRLAVTGSLLVFTALGVKKLLK